MFLRSFQHGAWSRIVKFDVGARVTRVRAVRLARIGVHLVTSDRFLSTFVIVATVAAFALRAS